MPDRETIWGALASVEDPELGYSITDLGLIYGVTVGEDGKRADIKMTFTSPGCPYAPLLLESVHKAVQEVADGLEEVHVEVVWDPPWDPYTMCDEDILMDLGLD